jgi:hypothetical protein
MWMWMREGERDPPQICSNLLPFRGKWIRGQNICPTTFAPHVWHLRGKLGVNLPHLPHLPHHPNRPVVLVDADERRCRWNGNRRPRHAWSRRPVVGGAMSRETYWLPRLSGCMLDCCAPVGLISLQRLN